MMTELETSKRYGKCATIVYAYVMPPTPNPGPAAAACATATAVSDGNKQIALYCTSGSACLARRAGQSHGELAPALGRLWVCSGSMRTPRLWTACRSSARCAPRGLAGRQGGRWGARQ